MKISMKRRLENVEQRIKPQEQRIIVLQQDGESREDMDARVERWKAGEDVPGLRSEEPYKGSELSVFYICFVEPTRQSEQGSDDGQERG
jgi:hypothetical protein